VLKVAEPVHRFLIRDRETKFTAQFRRIREEAGVETVLTPKRAPSCNVFVERFVLTLQPEAAVSAALSASWSASRSLVSVDAAGAGGSSGSSRFLP